MLTHLTMQAGIDSTLIADTDGIVLTKSIQTALNDPHGLEITLTSVSVVFLGLIALILAYTLIGKIVNFNTGKRKDVKQSASNGDAVPSPKEAAAIATALHLHLNEDIHDHESYVITIKSKRNNENI